MTPRIFIPLAALTALSFALAASPATADAPSDLIAQGRALLNMNNKDQALEVLNDAVAKNPSSAEAYTLLATADLRYGLPDDGFKAAQTAARLTTAPSDRAASTFLLGRAQLQVYMEKRAAIIKKFSGKQGENDLAEQMSTRSYDLPQGTSAVGSGIGNDAQSPDSATYSGVDQVGDATAQDDLRSDEQDRLDAINGLKGTLADVEKSFRNTLAADPSYPDAHDGLGLTLAVEGKPKDAIVQFQAEVQRDPADIPALAHLAGVQAQQGDVKGAIQSYRRVVRLNPRDQTSYAHLAALYNQQKDSLDEQWAKGMAFLLSGNENLAQAAFANVQTPTPAILRGQAMLAIAQNKPSDVQPLIEKAVALSPSDADSLVMLGDMQVNEGKQQDALNTYTSATASDPSNDAAWYGVGLVQDKLNDPKDAMTAYAKALAANPNNAFARINLAADQADAGMKTEAIANLREYQRRFPTAKDAADVENFIAQLTGA